MRRFTAIFLTLLCVAQARQIQTNDYTHESEKVRGARMTW